MTRKMYNKFEVQNTKLKADLKALKADVKDKVEAFKRFQTLVETIKLESADRKERIKDLLELLQFNPRVKRLCSKGIQFVVVAEDEPYYIAVYQLIREQARKKGTWSHYDEDCFKAAVIKFADNPIVLSGPAKVNTAIAG